MNTLVKSFIACVLVFGIVGCNDPKEDTSKQAENKNNTEVNGTKIDNPLDKLTATLPQGISADEARKVSNEATQKLFQAYFVNGAGKEMLENSIKIINARIEKMTKDGGFDGTNLNTLIADSAYGTNPQKDLKPMVGYLRSMNDEQKELYKRLIINYYVKKGYKVVEGNNNFTNDFHYSINW